MEIDAVGMMASQVESAAGEDYGSGEKNAQRGAGCR